VRALTGARPAPPHPEENFVEHYALDEWKLVYRVLHSRLKDHLELLDSHFFADLQTHLQRCAAADGVDVTDHGAWDAWLGNEPVSCAVRVAGREVLNGRKAVP
jgi:hypothetical protein